MTGVQYRAIQYGPVPAEYERLYLRLQDDGNIVAEERNGKNDQYVEVIFPTRLWSGEKPEFVRLMA